jgi:beta-N-acetylhexosaminidase
LATAVAIVLGCAIATMLVMAIVEAAVSARGPEPQRPATTRQPGTPLNLGDARYPGRQPPAAPPESEAPAPAATASARTPMRRLVGEKLMIRMSGTKPSPRLLARVRRGQVGGVVLFADNIGTKADLRALSQQLQDASRAGGGSGVFVAVDQEGGVVKRLSAGPPTQSAPEIGATGSSAIAQRQGSDTGAYLRNLGINVDFAPVADTPTGAQSFIANRAFARDPALVGRLATGFATGLQNQGVAATAKHFPGLGSSSTNTDQARSVISAPRSALDRQMRPFADPIRGGIQLVMTSTAVYPALDPNAPAAFSRKIVTGMLRESLQFHGLIVTDDLETPAVRSYLPPAEAAVSAVAAGNDMVLLVRSERGSRTAYKSLIAAGKSGRLTRPELEASHARLEALRGALTP